MPILVLAEHDNQQLKPQTRNVVAAASRLGGEIHLLVAGRNCQAVVEEGAALGGVSKVLAADASHLEAQLAEDLAALILSLASGYSHFLAPATASGKSTMPRVAARLDVSQISEIVAVLGPREFVRPIYAGSALATVRSQDQALVLTVRPTAFDPLDSVGRAPVEAVVVPPREIDIRLLSRELARSERPELADARVVVSGGRGLGSGDNYQRTLGPLADKLGAALGASRAAVDAGYVPNSLQVGQTGKIVAPQLYIAVGISGAIQHLAGMKDSRVIVAINKDPEAPIFQVADYGLVADLFEAVPALAQGL